MWLTCLTFMQVWVSLGTCCTKQYCIRIRSYFWIVINGEMLAEFKTAQKMLTIFNINLYERNATIFISEHYSPLTGCLACILLAYWLFISTYEAHINALFCMTMDQLHNGPWEKIKKIIMTLFNDFFSSGTVLRHYRRMCIAFLC